MQTLLSVLAVFEISSSFWRKKTHIDTQILQEVIKILGKMQPNSVRTLSLNLHFQLRTHLSLFLWSQFCAVIFTKMDLLGIKWILKFAKMAAADGCYIALWF